MICRNTTSNVFYQMVNTEAVSHQYGFVGQEGKNTGRQVLSREDALKYLNDNKYYKDAMNWAKNYLGE